MFCNRLHTKERTKKGNNYFTTRAMTLLELNFPEDPSSVRKIEQKPPEEDETEREGPSPFPQAEEVLERREHCRSERHAGGFGRDTGRYEEESMSGDDDEDREQRENLPRDFTDPATQPEEQADCGGNQNDRAEDKR